jgi:hypothetical protein
LARPRAEGRLALRWFEAECRRLGVG